jgi:hypothetical protein
LDADLPRVCESSVVVADPTDTPTEEAAKAVLAYFLRHPTAADTLTGIARWRLLEESVHHSVETTAAALKWLTAEGYLKEVSITGSAPVFRLSAEKRDDAAKLLG